MNSIYFYFNGRKSSDLGVYLVNMDSGLKSTRFLSNKEIISESIVGRDKPYVYGQNRTPLTFTLTLTLLNEKWTLDKRREVARWLSTDSFEEFYSTDAVEKRYFFQYVGGIDFTNNAAEDGYIQVEMLNSSPYAYSPFQEKIFNLSSITSPTIIEILNNGDKSVLPEMWLEKIDQGDIEIKNLSNSGKIFKFTALEDKETVYIDNQNRHIETDIPLSYRHDNFNKEYLELVRGVNRLEVTGTCKIKFRYQYVILG